MNTLTPKTVIGMVCYLWRMKDGIPEIYLAPKNPTPKAVERGLAGKLNGYGGGEEQVDGGSIFKTTIREVREESGVIIYEYGLEKVAKILFVNPWGNYLCYFLIAKVFSGEPLPSREMGWGKWYTFQTNAIPWSMMMPSDNYVLGAIVAGRKITGTIVHDEKMQVTKADITYVDHF